MSTESPFHVASTRDGHVKVRLHFSTWEPKHLRSHYLKHEASAAPPFLEDVSVLVPLERVYNRLSAFRDLFQALKNAGILAKQDTLKSFDLREEDDHTLAYVEAENEPC